MSFFEIWSELKDDGDDLKLKPSHLKRLLNDNKVREELQDGSVASLLPPVGTEVFRRLNSASLQEAEHPHEEQAGKGPKKTESQKEVNKHQSKPSSYLEAGEPTPFFFGDPHPDLLYRGLEELDPFYQSQKTFVVLSRGNILHRFNCGSSCNLLSPYDCLRTLSIKILLHPLFRWLIIFTLLTNCVFMTMTYSNLIMGCVFISVYIFEVLIKVSARGFCLGHFTFIKDPWNWLDLFVIIFTIADVFMEGFSVLAIVPRILKIFSASPGLRKAAKSFVHSMKRLISAFILNVFVMSILAAIALHLFIGDLRNKCVSMQTGNDTEENLNNIMIYYDDSKHLKYSEHIQNKENHFYLPNQMDPLVCGNSSGARICPEGFMCLGVGQNPNYGYTGYDSFGLSLLSIFRLLTQCFIENLIQLTLNGAGKIYILVFVLLFIPSCFMLVSLILAAVVMGFVDQKKTENSKRKQKEKDFRQIEEVLRRGESGELEEASSGVARSETKIQNKGASLTETKGDHRPSPYCWRQRLWLQPFVLSPYFDLIIILCLITNIIFIAMVHFPLTMEFEEMLAISNLVFPAIYVLEMFLRMLALGVRGYFQVRWHIFDFLLVLLSFVELGMADIWGIELPQLRILRLARWWPLLHLFLWHVWSSVQRVTVIFLVLVFMFVVAGLQLFQIDYIDEVCKISVDCELPRWHMHDFFHSFMAVTRVLWGDWVELLWDCMEVSGQGICVVYFSVVLITGQLLMLVLFLNLVLNSGIDGKLKSAEESNPLQISMKQIWTQIQNCCRKRQKGNKDPDRDEADSSKDERKEFVSLTLVTSDDDQENQNGENKNLDSCRDGSSESKVKKDVEEPNEKGHQKENTPEDCCWTCCYTCCPFQETGSGPIWSNFRRTCLRIVVNRFFEGFMFFIIILSSAALMFEDIYLEQRPILQTVLDHADWIFSLIFLLEMLLKWTAFGLKKYFSNFYCCVDFLILAVAVFSPILQLLGVSSRPLRALQILRTPSRLKGVKVVLRALAVTMPSLLSVLLVGLVVWLMFATLGVRMFAGKFYYCFNETSEDFFSSDAVENMSVCQELIEMNYTEVRWKNAVFNFDSVMMSFVSLFMTVFSGGIFDILYFALDSREVSLQPKYESNLSSYLFFLCFFIIGGFLTFSFFIKVFVHKLHQERHQFGGNHLFITEEQQIYTRGLKKRFTSKPTHNFPPPQNRCQAWLFKVLTSRCYEIFMMVVICLNLVVYMLDTNDDGNEKFTIMAFLHLSFLLIFLCEFILKIIALRQFYFRCSLNILDFIVLVWSITCFILAGVFPFHFLYPYYPVQIVVFRLARLGRVLRFSRIFQGIRTLLLGFMMSLPALLNIGLLFLVILFFFSAVGMMNFGFVKKELAIDDMYNFETFWNSVISMILVSPSSSWGGMLMPMMRKIPDCGPFSENPGFSVIGDCSSPVFGIIFFTSYIVLFFLLRVLLFVVVILETFNGRRSKHAEDLQQLSDRLLQMFCKTWKRFDSKDSQAIQHSELSDFCDALQDPLRIPKPNETQLANLDLPLHPGEQIHCVDVLQALTAQAFGESGQDGALKSRLEETFKNLPKVSDEPISSTSQ